MPKEETATVEQHASGLIYLTTDSCSTTVRIKLIAAKVAKQSVFIVPRPPPPPANGGKGSEKLNWPAVKTEASFHKKTPK